MCGERAVHFHTSCIAAFRYTSRSERGLPSAGKHTKGCCGQESDPISSESGERAWNGAPWQVWGRGLFRRPVMECGCSISAAWWKDSSTLRQQCSLFLQIFHWLALWLGHYWLLLWNFSEGCAIENGWCFFLEIPKKWSIKSPIMEPTSGKWKKSICFSAYCWDKTAIYHDRAFQKASSSPFLWRGLSKGFVLVCGCFISTERWKIQPFFQFSPRREPRLRPFPVIYLKFQGKSINLFL